jgi:hypothetical protein
MPWELKYQTPGLFLAVGLRNRGVVAKHQEKNPESEH